jgi:cell wall-associated NlpC family hydrolase
MARVLSLVLLGIDKVSPALKHIDKNLDRIQSKMSKAALAGGLVAASGAATQLTAALLPVASAAGALPGAFAVAKAASLTTKVAFAGLGEAMSAVAEGDAKKLKEAMKDLSPNAQAVVKESAKIIGVFDDLKASVQQNAFAGIAPHMREVAGNLAPAVKTGMSGVAAEMNKAGKEALKFGATPVAKGLIKDIFSTTAGVIRNATGAVQPFLGAVAKLTQISLPFAKNLASIAINSIKMGSAFVQSERGANMLQGMIQRGIDRLLQLGRIVKNTVVGLVSMFRQVNVSGGSILDTIERLTAKFAAWGKSAEGQKATAEVMKTLVQTFQQMAQLAPLVLSPLIVLARIIGGLPEPVRSWATGLLAAAVVFGPLVSKVWALGAALVAGTKAIVAWNLGTKIGTAATKLWAGAVWLLNAAMRANPIGIVITIITALIGAIVLAYNKSETFRKIVDAAWAGIKNAVSAAWNGFIKPAFEAIKTWIVTELAPRFMWFHNNIVTPVWNGIKTVISVVWNVVKVIFEAYKFYITKVLAPVFTWIWKNIITPAWKGIEFIIKVVWGIIKIIFAAIKFYIEKVLAPVFTWIWRNIVTPVFNGIKTIITAVWNNGVKPIFENMKKGVQLVGKAFESAKNFIGRVWDKVRDLAMKPVRFVVDTVYTKGIKGVWDTVARFVGASPLPAAPRFATGGKINVGSGPKSDDVLVRASRNEYVVNAAATARNLPLIDFINRRGKNKSILKELGYAGDPGGVLPGFAEGGIIGWVKGFAAKAKDGFLDGAIKAAHAVFNPIKGLIDNTIGRVPIGRTIGGIPKKYMNDFVDWIASHKTKLEGGGSQKAVQAARSQIGVPYSWGGGGPGGPSYGFAQGAGIRGFDCSSLMQYAWYKATGKVMPRTTYTQWPWLNKVSSPAPGDLGFPHMGHVFMYSGKNRIIEAPYTGARVREVGARSAKWGRPPASFMRADDGMARLSPGLNAVYNGTGGMETLSNNPPIIVEKIELHFADDRNMREKGQEFAEGLRYYANQGGKLPAKLIGN